MSGLEYMQAVVRGELPGPPIGRLMGFEMVSVEAGRTVFSVSPGEQHYNVIGMVHGGLAATLLDSAMGCAVLSELPKERTFTTMQLNLHYVKAITAETGKLLCDARVVHRGRQVSTAEGKIVDGGGKVYAHGTTTCLILPAPL